MYNELKVDMTSETKCGKTDLQIKLGPRLLLASLGVSAKEIRKLQVSCGAGEPAWWFRTPAALPEDPAESPALMPAASSCL